MNSEIKKTVGRPKKTRLTKTLSVTIPLEVYNSPMFKAKTKYSSFSSYMNYLLDQNLKQS